MLAQILSYDKSVILYFAIKRAEKTLARKGWKKMDYAYDTEFFGNTDREGT